MTYISSLISGVGIFCFGTGLAWYHGVLVLLHPQEMESAIWVKKKELRFYFKIYGVAFF
jgi:zinc transporter 9